MDQEIKRRQWPGVRPVGLRSAPGVGQSAADIDLWLRLNVLASSYQEYQRYRAYLETDPVPDEVPGS